MKNTIEQLVHLQQIDRQIYELENSKGDLPEMVRHIKEELSELTKSIEDKTKFLEEVRKEKRLKEGDLTLTEEKLKKHQNQLYDVTTNREYDAITQEIEQEKEVINGSETRILELINLDEETTQHIEKNNEEIKKIKGDLEEKETELRRMEKNNEASELKLMHEREKILVRLNKGVLGQYRRILQAKNHLAVVPITRGACGGCYNRIPPQRIVEIRKMERIFTCEVCARILVWQENGSIIHEQ